MKSNTIYSKGLAIAAALFLGLMNLTPVAAAGTTQIKLDSTTAEVGDTVNVTVTASESGTVSLKFNNNVLQLENAGGATVNQNVLTFTGTSASFTFSTIAEGNGDLMVSSDTLTGSSTTVGVSGGSTEEEEKEEEKEEEEKKEETEADSAEGDFTIDGVAYVLSERFSDDEIPAGFSKKAIEFPSGTYNELASDTMTLVYLKPASNTDGDGQFYIYNADDNSVTPFTMLGSGDSYVVVQTAPELFSDSLTEATFTANETEYTGYQVKGISNDFYFVYGIEKSGESGWYQYDSAKGTIQRANTEVVGSASSGDKAGEKKKGSTNGIGKLTFGDSIKKLKNTRTILGILVFAAAVLIIIIIDILLFRRGTDEGDVFDELDDEMGGDPTDYSVTPTVSDITAEAEEAEAKEEKKSHKKSDKKSEPEENEVEVFTLDDVLDDVEEDLSTQTKDNNKSGKGLFGRKSKDIWDAEEEKNSTDGLPSLDDRSKLKKQVFKNNTPSESSDNFEGKVDLIDFNDL